MRGRVQQTILRLKIPAAILLILLTLTVTACDRDEGATVSTPQETDQRVQSLFEDEPTAQRSTEKGAQKEEDTSLGHLLYAGNCAVCHGSRGGGDVGPALAGNSVLQNEDYVIAQILLGGGGMPPFAPRFSQPEIAAVATHIRTSWGNNFGVVSAQQVEVQRSGLRPGMRLRQSGEPPLGQEGGQQGLPLGEQTYFRQGCSGCHGPNGGGGIGPALAGNRQLADDEYIINQILRGGGGMPPYADQLSDEQIAAVASHERMSWGNDFGGVMASQVAQHRQPPDQAQIEPQRQGQARQQQGTPAQQRQDTLHGGLEITVEPGDARIVVTGPNRYVNFAAHASHRTLRGLQPGTYAVTATKNRYQAAFAQVEVDAEEPLSVSLVLQPLSEGPEDQQPLEQEGGQ